MKGRATGRKLVWITGVALIGLLAFAAASWKKLATHYYLFRLEKDPSSLPDVLGAPPSSPRHEALLEYSRTPEGATTILRAFVEDAKLSLAADHKLGSAMEPTILGATDTVRFLILGVCRRVGPPDTIHYWYDCWAGVADDRVVATPALAGQLYDALALLRGRRMMLPEFPSLMFRVVTSEEALDLPRRSGYVMPFAPLPDGACPLVCLAVGPEIRVIPRWLRKMAGMRP